MFKSGVSGTLGRLMWHIQEKHRQARSKFDKQKMFFGQLFAEEAEEAAPKAIGYQDPFGQWQGSEEGTACSAHMWGTPHPGVVIINAHSKPPQVSFKPPHVSLRL